MCKYLYGVYQTTLWCVLALIKAAYDNRVVEIDKGVAIYDNSGGYGFQFQVSYNDMKYGKKHND